VEENKRLGKYGQNRCLTSMQWRHRPDQLTSGNSWGEVIITSRYKHVEVQTDRWSKCLPIRQRIV
jgi:hypothetical protein